MAPTLFHGSRGRPRVDTINRMINRLVRRSVAVLAPLTILAVASAAGAQNIRVDLAYRAPVDGQTKPNFSPKGTQVPLTAFTSVSSLPAGSVLPARTGMIKVGPDQRSWVPVLVTSDSLHPSDFTRLFIDRNRNGDFTDDGPPLSATPAQNAKTKVWWTSINKVELSVSYDASRPPEPYLVNVWMVRDDSAGPPDVLRYSVGSWRYGTVTVKGVNALIAVMDDNDAVFTKDDMWSALAASDPNAAKSVLTIAEARPTNRLMFLTNGGKEIPLEFRSISPDGRSMELAVVDRVITKAADRAPDDNLRDERPRPRATIPFEWGHGSKDFTAAVARAKATGKKVFLDFEATWCGPCHTMDQWIWNDAEVAAELNAGYIGVKIDVDLEKPLVKKFKTTGYPTMIVLNSAAKEIARVTEYQSSKDMLAVLRAKH